MDNILDHVVVQGQRYDIVSPTAFGAYIETIGSACINPDGYAQGSTFLARLGNEQFYYEATAAITQGSAISEGTNCKRTTVTGREEELASEIETLGNNVTSLSEALTNEITARAILGAHNLLDDSTFRQGDYNNVAVSTRVSISLKDRLYFEAGSKYILTSSNISDELHIAVFLTDASNNILEQYASLANSFTNPLVIEPTVSGYFTLVFKKGQDLLINPDDARSYKMMLRIATDNNTDYLPHAKTNRELTDKVNKLEVLVLSTGNTAVNALPYTFLNENIETDMVCLKAVLGTPNAQSGDWTVTTDTEGQAVISGTLNGSTTITLYMMKSR